MRVLATGQTSRVSIATGGGQAAGASEHATRSADGGLVAFESDAALVAADSNGKRDVYGHDRAAASSAGDVSSTGSQSADDCLSPSLSADGSHVALTSLAANLVAGDGNDAWAAFVRDRTTGTTRQCVQADGRAVTLVHHFRPARPRAAPACVESGATGECASRLESRARG